jgi:hypothetical protein
VAVTGTSTAGLADLTRTLAETEWRERAERHATRVDALVGDHLRRRSAGERHPVEDFLFTYYNLKPSQLRRWHPGAGAVLLGEGARERLSERFYTELPGGVGLDVPAFLAARPVLDFVERLLSSVAERPAHLGCFGLHEWAMVYRLAEDETRHADWPLRLGATGTDEVVDSHRIACSHFDAYRFFTSPARPLNTLSPGRDDRDTFEQPGCLHAGMDLYGKVAVRLMPMIPSDLLADAFELAWDIRVMDMRAAPYDLSGLDLGGEEWTPIRIETPDGKREYAEAQRAYSERAAPIRAALIGACERLLGRP